VLASLIIFFRESLEASLIVGIILAYLTRVRRPREIRWVWVGVGVAVLLDLAVGLALYHVIRHYDGSRLQTILEGTTYLVAAFMLTYMSFWMKRESRAMKGTLEAQVEHALTTGSRLALVGIPILTVGREGLETVFFMLAIAFSATPLALGTGAVLGLILGLSVVRATYRFGRRLPLHVFFNGLGILLLIFGAGLLADGIEDYQALGWLPWMTTAVWHTGRWLSESSVVGDILHSFIGYADSPSGLQFAAWAVFLALTLPRYIGTGRGPKSRDASQGAAPQP
jgi:high-affinity iron transporter